MQPETISDPHFLLRSRFWQDWKLMCVEEKDKGRGTSAHFSHCCLVMVSIDQRSSLMLPESKPWNEQRDCEGSKGRQDRASTSKFKVTNMLPHPSHPLRLRVHRMYPCSPHSPPCGSLTLALNISAPRCGKEAFYVGLTLPRAPTRAQSQLHTLFIPHLKFSM